VFVVLATSVSVTLVNRLFGVHLHGNFQVVGTISNFLCTVNSVKTPQKPTLTVTTLLSQISAVIILFAFVGVTDTSKRYSRTKPVANCIISVCRPVIFYRIRNVAVTLPGGGVCHHYGAGENDKNTHFAIGPNFKSVQSILDFQLNPCSAGWRFLATENFVTKKNNKKKNSKLKRLLSN